MSWADKGTNVPTNSWTEFDDVVGQNGPVLYRFVNLSEQGYRVPIQVAYGVGDDRALLVLPVDWLEPPPFGTLFIVEPFLDANLGAGVIFFRLRGQSFPAPSVRLERWEP